MIIETIKIERIGLKLCKIQGELFAPSLIEASKVQQYSFVDL